MYELQVRIHTQLIVITSQTIKLELSSVLTEQTVPRVTQLESVSVTPEKFENPGDLKLGKTSFPA